MQCARKRECWNPPSFLLWSRSGPPLRMVRSWKISRRVTSFNAFLSLFFFLLFNLFKYARRPSGVACGTWLVVFCGDAVSVGTFEVGKSVSILLHTLWHLGGNCPLLWSVETICSPQMPPNKRGNNPRRYAGVGYCRQPRFGTWLAPLPVPRFLPVYILWHLICRCTAVFLGYCLLVSMSSFFVIFILASPSHSWRAMAKQMAAYIFGRECSEEGVCVPESLLCLFSCMSFSHPGDGLQEGEEEGVWMWNGLCDIF